MMYRIKSLYDNKLEEWRDGFTMDMVRDLIQKSKNNN